MPLTGGNVCFVPRSRGYYRYIKPADPGAGNPVTWTHSGLDEALLLITMYCRLGTAMSGLDRSVRMRAFSSSGRTLWMHKCDFLHPDIKIYRYSWDQHNGNKNTFRGNTLVSGPVPYLWLLPLASITLDADNLDAGDSFLDCVLQVKSYRVKV